MSDKMLVRAQIFVLFATIFVCVQASPIQDLKEVLKYLSEKSDQVYEKCIEESGATDDDLEALEEGKIPETQTGKCMIACEFMEYGIIDENEKYNKYGFLDILPKSLREHESLEGFKRLAERCETAVLRVTEDVCELARKLKLCFHQHAAEYGIKYFVGLDILDDADSDY